MRTKQHTPPAAAARTVAAAIATPAVAACLFAATAAAACLVLACLFAACTADNDPTAAPGDFAPGTVPIILTVPAIATPASAPAPTRAALPGGTPEGQWTEGDPVAVEVNGVMKYYLVASGIGATTARLVPLNTSYTHYWPSSTSPVSVRAWCRGSGNYYGTLPGETNPWVIDQNQRDVVDGRTGYQCSDFLYAPARDITYAGQQAGTEALTFYHQTARVVIRIRMGGVVTDAKDYLAANITSEAFNSAVFDVSLIDLSAGQYSGLKALENKGYSVAKEILPTPAGYARCYEALVIPQDMKGKKFIEVIDGSGNRYYYTPGAGEADLRGGYTYTYDITVSEHGSLHVTAAPPIAGWVDDGEGGSGTAVEEPTLIDLSRTNNITDNRTYLLTGTNTTTYAIVQIQGSSPTIIVQDADIRCYMPVSIVGGTPEIRVVGTNNRLEGTSGIPAIFLGGENANVRITGDGPGKSALTARVSNSGGSAPAIGSFDVCGNISITGIKLTARGEPDNSSGGPAIGISDGSGYNNRRCGSITLTDCDLELVPGPGAAAIGFGYWKAAAASSTHEIGDITIDGCTIKSTITPIMQLGTLIYPAHILGSGYGAGTYSVGEVIITPPRGMGGAAFFAGFTREGATHADADVIIGFSAGVGTPTSVNEYKSYWQPSSGNYMLSTGPATWSIVLGFPQ